GWTEKGVEPILEKGSSPLPAANRSAPSLKIGSTPFSIPRPKRKCRPAARPDGIRAIAAQSKKICSDAPTSRGRPTVAASTENAPDTIPEFRYFSLLRFVPNTESRQFSLGGS